LMREYGTQIVGGITPGKGGQTHEGIPVFDTVVEARRETGAEASITFVPKSAAVDSMVEAIRAGLRLVVCITDGIPVHDMLLVRAMAREAHCTLIGPNCPGLITPGKSKLGFMPSHVYDPGSVGVVSKSGSLSYEVAYELTRAGLGQSTVVGIGGDPVKGCSFVDLLPFFVDDPGTQAIVLLGEIGGTDEELAADWLEENRTRKPVIAYMVGRTSPPFVKMGHPGTLFVRNDRSFVEKVERLRAAGVTIASSPWDVVACTQSAMGR
ncbi:MAG TPA: succinate--CoA ligase subunit alpha, partial [Candidatus Methylomirabilis sp.]|nr:succinate--CoA ligase subunit alpha [Candidatus Methylomirabilis sp.]